MGVVTSHSIWLHNLNANPACYLYIGLLCVAVEIQAFMCAMNYVLGIWKKKVNQDQKLLSVEIILQQSSLKPYFY